MGTDSVIFIRTDGNSKIATGHLVRCLCIASALEKEGKRVVFLLSDEESHKLLRDLSSTIFSDIPFSYETIVLQNTTFDNMEKELPELIKLLKPYNSPVLLIDSYFVTPYYFSALKQVATLAYMDDLRAFDYDVDFVINYDVIPDSKRPAYEQAYTKAGKRLLGAEYTPLRPQFQNQTFFVKEKIDNILLTTGGSDPYHFCETFVPSFLSENKEITLHIVIGKLFTDSTITALEELASQSPWVKLHRNVTDMASLMKQCDFAISAAGTTLYELCAIGVPAVSFTFADNQLIMAETFAECDAIPYAGDLRPEHKQCIPPIKECPKENKIEILFTNITENGINNIIQNINIRVKNLISAPDTRKKLLTKMQSLVDGNGTSKIAKALCR